MGRGIGFSVRIAARFDEKKTWLNIYIYKWNRKVIGIYIYIYSCVPGMNDAVPFYYVLIKI